ncbi:MAG: hypothetical protein JO147_14160 [Actinobacteria bacterium]|nr:hypothetical protein [Actinomycetota bacterium]
MPTAFPTVTAAGDALSIAVTGVGSSTLPVTALRCASNTVTGAVGTGRITLDLTAATLHVIDVAPVGSADFSGKTTRTGSTLGFGGATTGMSAALRVSCPE